MTYDTLIRDCIAEALCLPRDPIQSELLDVGLASANEHALIIWMSWKWDNEKMDEFTTPTVGADGIITFASDVDSVMAVKCLNDGSDVEVPIWPEDEYLAASQGGTVSSDRFQQIASTTAGLRRIKVEVPETGETPVYKALCLKKYVDAIIDPAYPATLPATTPTDYRVLEVVIDRGIPALKAAVKDSLRRMQGMNPDGNFKALLNLALQRETYDSARDRRTNPRSPGYSDVGAWDSDG
jgi:hypothetical protein